MGRECGSRNISDGTSKEIDSMDNTILRGDSWLSDVGVAELKCNRVESGLGILIHEMISLIVVEGRINIETLARAELTRLAVDGLSVDDNATT